MESLEKSGRVAKKKKMGSGVWGWAEIEGGGSGLRPGGGRSWEGRLRGGGYWYSCAEAVLLPAVSPPHQGHRRARPAVLC